MSTILVNTLPGTTTAGSIAVTGEGNSTTTNLQQGLTKCWVNFDGESAVAAARDSFNVDSMTDNGGNGDYKITYTNPFSNNDYAFSGGIAASGNASGWVGGTTSMADSDFATDSLEVGTFYQNAGFTNFKYVTVMINGDLA